MLQHLLFTMDVQSLYTSIPHQEGLRPLCFILEQKPEPSPPTTTLLHMAELVLTLNNFSFNSSHFHQVRRVAMGTRMGPSYAGFFFLHLRRIYLDEANFDKGASEISTFFLNRGFPSTVVDRALNQ
eukprot:g20603.t1